MNRQKQLLFVLGLLFLLAVTYSYIKFPRQKKVEKLTYTQGVTATSSANRANAATDSKDDTSVLRMDLLSLGDLPASVKRNLFVPVFFDESKKLSAKASRGAAVKPPPPPPPPPPPTQQEIARQMLNGYRSLGMLRKGGTRIAFLARGEEVVLVRLGDRPIPGYSAVSITDERLTLRSLDGSDEIHLALQ